MRSQVWNEDLVRAFKVREGEARSRGTRYFHWGEAAEKIQKCGKDIYEQNCRDGGTKIVNKPQGLSTTASDLLERIVRGPALVVPPGMEAFGEHACAHAKLLRCTPLFRGSDSAISFRLSCLLALCLDTINNGGGQVPAPAEDDLSDHQYLQNMQHRGGGYAILMAFHSERRRRGPAFRGPLHKDEIIRLAQVQAHALGVDIIIRQDNA